MSAPSPPLVSPGVADEKEAAAAGAPKQSDASDRGDTPVFTEQGAYTGAALLDKYSKRWGELRSRREDSHSAAEAVSQTARGVHSRVLAHQAELESFEAGLSSLAAMQRQALRVSSDIQSMCRKIDQLEIVLEVLREGKESAIASAMAAQTRSRVRRNEDNEDGILMHSPDDPGEPQGTSALRGVCKGTGWQRALNAAVNPKHYPNMDSEAAADARKADFAAAVERARKTTRDPFVV